MTAIRGARERARSEITAAIKDEARRQLAAEGATKLSLRAVARALGMASSALYRYFPSRDDLLTALILDAYHAIGAAAEAADPGVGESGAGGPEVGGSGEPGGPAEAGDAVGASVSGASAPGGPGRAAGARAADAGGSSAGVRGPGPRASGARGGGAAAGCVERWVAVCGGVRAWALAHPHEYALLYGTPVPGYHAPRATAAPAGRVARALIAVVRDARAVGALHEPPGPLPDAVAAEARALMAELDIELPAPVMAALVATWAQLFGLISFELFGQFNQVVEDRDAFFAHTARRLAGGVGLIAEPGDPG